MIKAYYRIAKPGIIYGNSITAAAGFFLATFSSHIFQVGAGGVSWLLLLAMLLGLGLVIGGSAVFNNYLDRDIDAKMERTKSRASVTGEISKTSIIIYGSCLLLVGLLILYFFTNLLTLIIALIGVLFYLALYSPLKRRTVYSPLVGSIAGAVPPLVGFCAVSNTFNLEAFVLCLIFILWQMPHFYAIAMYKGEDYAAAGIPVLSLKRGTRTAKIHILLYVIAFTVAAASLTLLGFTGYIYLVVVLLLGIAWLRRGIQGFRSGISNAGELVWARKMFLFSLIVVLVLSVALALGAVLP